MIKIRLNKNANKIDKFLINFIRNQKKSLLVQPMKYGVISGGKKIRSTIIFDTGRLLNINQKKLINICAAVESLNLYPIGSILLKWNLFTFWIESTLSYK